MKLFRNLGKYPFIMLLSASAIILTVTAYIGKNSVYAAYSVNLIKNPRLVVVFEGIKDQNYPWEVLIDKKEKNIAIGDNTIEALEKKTPIKEKHLVKENLPIKEKQPIKKKNLKNEKQSIESGSTISRNGSKNSIQSVADEKTDSSTDITGSDTGGTGKKKGDKKSVKSKSFQSSNKFKTVKESYFDDALFIGDSRTVGLAEYSGWKKPTFYADVGLTIYDIFDKKAAEVGGKKMTIEKALQKKSFKKIYIMLGINELGTGNAKSFTKAYKGVVERIKKLQPDAIIFVEAIMNVAKKKSDMDPVFNNTNIKDRNKHLATLADNKKIFYINVNEAITDKTGGIPAKYTFDNIHLKAAYYKIWTDFLLKHGVIVK